MSGIFNKVKENRFTSVFWLFSLDSSLSWISSPFFCGGREMDFGNAFKFSFFLLNYYLLDSFSWSTISVPLRGKLFLLTSKPLSQSQSPLAGEARPGREPWLTWECPANRQWAWRLCPQQQHSEREQGKHASDICMRTAWALSPLVKEPGIPQQAELISLPVNYLTSRNLFPFNIQWLWK